MHARKCYLFPIVVFVIWFFIPMCYVSPNSVIRSLSLSLTCMTLTVCIPLTISTLYICLLFFSFLIFFLGGGLPNYLVWRNKLNFNLIYYLLKKKFNQRKRIIKFFKFWPLRDDHYSRERDQNQKGFMIGLITYRL